MGSFCWSCSVAPCWPTIWRRTSRTSSASWRASNLRSGRRAGVLPTSSGTDNVGRDIWSRIIHGSRISLIVGIAAVGISLLIGVTLGLLSGFLGGRVDATIMALVDIMLAFPPLILAFAMVAVLGPGIGNIILVLGLTGWERYARVVRAEVLALREREFVQAARAIGVPTSTSSSVTSCPTPSRRSLSWPPCKLPRPF